MDDDIGSVEELGLGSYTNPIEDHLGGPLEREEAYDQQEADRRSRNDAIFAGRFALAGASLLGGIAGTSYALETGDIELAKLSAVGGLTGISLAVSAGALEEPRYGTRGRFSIDKDYTFFQEGSEAGAGEFLAAADAVLAYDEEDDSWEPVEDGALDTLYDDIVEGSAPVNALHVDEREDGPAAFELHTAADGELYRFAGWKTNPDAFLEQYDDSPADMETYRRAAGAG